MSSRAVLPVEGLCAPPSFSDGTEIEPGASRCLDAAATRHAGPPTICRQRSPFVHRHSLGLARTVARRLYGRVAVRMPEAGPAASRVMASGHVGARPLPASRTTRNVLCNFHRNTLAWFPYIRFGTDVWAVRSDASPTGQAQMMKQVLRLALLRTRNERNRADGSTHRSCRCSNDRNTGV